MTWFYGGAHLYCAALRGACFYHRRLSSEQQKAKMREDKDLALMTSNHSKPCGL